MRWIARLLLTLVLLWAVVVPAYGVPLIGSTDPEAGLSEAERDLIGAFDPNAAPDVKGILRGLLENLDVLDLDGCLHLLSLCLAAGGGERTTGGHGGLHLRQRSLHRRPEIHARRWDRDRHADA